MVHLNNACRRWGHCLVWLSLAHSWYACAKIWWTTANKKPVPVLCWCPHKQPSPVNGAGITIVLVAAESAKEAFNTSQHFYLHSGTLKTAIVIPPSSTWCCASIPSLQWLQRAPCSRLHEDKTTSSMLTRKCSKNWNSSQSENESWTMNKTDIKLMKRYHIQFFLMYVEAWLNSEENMQWNKNTNQKLRKVLFLQNFFLQEKDMKMLQV